MSDLTVADAKADAAAKYDAYREAYSAWWNAVQVVAHLSAEQRHARKESANDHG